jgi:hypothetical protein
MYYDVVMKFNESRAHDSGLSVKSYPAASFTRPPKAAPVRYGRVTWLEISGRNKSLSSHIE